MHFYGLEDRCALVTGASRGIGRATAIALAEVGARVAINYHSNEAAAKETLKQVRAVGSDGILIKADVSKREDVDTMVAEVEEHLGPVDLLAANAGLIAFQHHSEMTDETWESMYNVNVDGVRNCMMAVKDGMIERDYGRIVALSSVAGLAPRPTMLAYSSAKAAVVALVRCSAAAFGPSVRVNCVAPGLIRTDMTDHVQGEARQAMLDEAMLKRDGGPEEIADLVTYLLSDRSSFITGQTIVADGGRITLP